MTDLRVDSGFRVATTSDGLVSIQTTRDRKWDGNWPNNLNNKKITVNGKEYPVIEDIRTESEMTYTGIPPIIYGDWKEKQKQKIIADYGKDININNIETEILTQLYKCALKHDTVDKYLNDINSVVDGICSIRGITSLEWGLQKRQEFYYKVQSLEIIEKELIPKLYECKGFSRPSAGVDDYVPNNTVCVSKLQLSEYEKNFVGFNKETFFTSLWEHMKARDKINWSTWLYSEFKKTGYYDTQKVLLSGKGKGIGLEFDYFKTLKTKSPIHYDITLTEKMNDVEINVINARKWLNSFLDACKNSQPQGAKLLDCDAEKTPLERYLSKSTVLDKAKRFYIYDKNKGYIDEPGWFSWTKGIIANIDPNEEAKINGAVIYKPGSMNCDGYSVWEGEKVNLENKPIGVGIFTCYDKADKSKIKSEYIGNFKDGIFRGSGQITEYIDGKKIIYKGSFDNNQKSGLGVLEFYDNDKIENDKPYLKYTGNFKNDVINGYGKIIMGDADFYCKFIDGKCSSIKEAGYTKIKGISGPTTREQELKAGREDKRRSWVLTNKQKSSDGKCRYTFNNIEFMKLLQNKNIPYLKNVFNDWNPLEYEGSCDNFDAMKIYDGQNYDGQEFFYKLDFVDKESDGVNIGEIPESIKNKYIPRIPFGLYQKGAYDGVVFNPVDLGREIVLEFEPYEYGI